MAAWNDAGRGSAQAPRLAALTASTIIWIVEPRRGAVIIDDGSPDAILGLFLAMAPNRIARGSHLVALP